MHACTHACMHACVCTHTFIHLHPDMKSIKIKANNFYEKKNKYIHVILLQVSEVDEESFWLSYCLKAIWICIHLYTCIIKIKAMDLHLKKAKYIIWVRTRENFGKIFHNKKLRGMKKWELPPTKKIYIIFYTERAKRVRKIFGWSLYIAWKEFQIREIKG